MRTSRRILVAVVALLGCSSAPAPAAADWLVQGNPVCTRDTTQFDPTIVGDGASGAIIAWEDNRNGLRDIYAQRVDSTGAMLWTPDGVPVCTAIGSQYGAVAAPGLVGGGATIFWVDERDVAARGTDIYAQRLSAQGVAQWIGNGVVIANDDEENETSPAVITDGKVAVIEPAGYIVSFTDHSRGALPIRRSVAVQHVNTDGTGLWTTAASGGVRLCSNVEFASATRITTDGIGTSTTGRGAVVAWMNQDVGDTDSDIRARRINNAGGAQWTANGVAVCDDPNLQQTPDIVHVGSGNVIVVWDDWRAGGGNPNLWAQKLNSSGAEQWTHNGLPVCTATGTQSSPRIVDDGAGGAIVAWVDSRTSPSRIHVQRVDGNGQRLWNPSDGIPLTQPTGAAQTFPVMVAVGGGAIVAWIDARNGNNDIYAQRVDANGNLLWGSGGVAVCTAAANQLEQELISDGAFGGLVAWSDVRSGTRDIYANRIFATGMVDVAPTASGELGLRFLSSHPASGQVRMRLDLPAPATVRMDVVDPQGRRVRSSEPSRLGGGTHVLTWDGCDDSGSAVAAGVYFVRVEAGARRLTLRVVEIR